MFETHQEPEVFGTDLSGTWIGECENLKGIHGSNGNMEGIGMLSHKEVCNPQLTCKTQVYQVISIPGCNK